MPKLKPETIRDRHKGAKAAVEAAQKVLSKIAKEGSRLDGIYLCTSRPSGTSYGGNKEQQLMHVRWQLTRKDGSSYPKGTLSYADALKRCERGKRYAVACKQLDKAYTELARWEKKLSALTITTPPSISRKEDAANQDRNGIRQVA